MTDNFGRAAMTMVEIDGTPRARVDLPIAWQASVDKTLPQSHEQRTNGRDHRSSETECC